MRTDLLKIPAWNEAGITAELLTTPLLLILSCYSRGAPVFLVAGISRFYTIEL